MKDLLIIFFCAVIGYSSWTISELQKQNNQLQKQNSALNHTIEFNLSYIKLLEK